MTLKRVSVIFGTRPETIKLAPVIRALRESNDFTPNACVTAQHRQMLDQVLRVFEIEPDVDLNLMEPNQSLSTLAAKILMGLDGYLEQVKPDWVIVQGDTTTTMCGALSAFYRGIPVAHVEAGLRTGRMDAPFPEEMNRVITSRLATLHLAPTLGAKENLLREGVPETRVVVTGNTVVDALLFAVDHVRANPPYVPGLPDGLLNAWPKPRLVLITGHRRESFGEGFRRICKAIAILADHHKDTIFVYPVHLNPNVREPVHSLLGGRPNVHLIEPLDYLAFIHLMDRCNLILTDSGGIQEEAPTLGKPVLIMRDVTERPEAVETGVAELVGTSVKCIVSEVEKSLVGDSAENRVSLENPFGDGHAADRCLEALRKFEPCAKAPAEIQPNSGHA